jgi:transitional endoplasmic reticulum ATPase
MATTAPSSIRYTGDKTEIDEVRTLLAAHAGSTYSVDQGVAYHREPPNKISLPEGMTPGKGAEVLSDLEKQQQQTELYHFDFNFRPYDGAYAVRQVMTKYFGTTGRGKAQMSFFGIQPPEKISVWISPTEQVNIPWGEIEFKPVSGSITLSAYKDPEFGFLFRITVKCPGKFEEVARGFAMLVEEELQQYSIYKGKSIQQAHTDIPRFIDVKNNPTVLYNPDVNSALHTAVWGVLENRELVKSDGNKVNNRVLLHGPYGTGKSEAGMRTADVANAHGTTFIQFHSGKAGLDDLEATIATARLYSPSVVFVEDIDVYAKNPDENFQTRLSNLFDGIGSKGDEVMIVMTSNHPASFSKGMLRPGRIDYMIEIGSLDKETCRRLIDILVGEARLDDDFDFDSVWGAIDTMQPATVRQVIDRARIAALLREGTRDYRLSTDDFLGAALLCKPQHDAHMGASDKKVETFDSAFTQKITEAAEAAVVGVFGRTTVDLEDGELMIQDRNS